MAITAVFFDVGGTLIDEARLLTGWAASLGVDPLDFLAALGASIQAREPHRAVFDRVAPGADLPAIRARRKEQGAEFFLEGRDLYPDALPALAACKAAGLFVGVAGNQPRSAEAALMKAGVRADVLAASETWGVAKPDPDFFTRVAQSCGHPPDQIAYVGDRVDNDVVPARAAGMRPVLLIRGPYGMAQCTWPEASQAALTLRTLIGLPEALAAI